MHSPIISKTLTATTATFIHSEPKSMLMMVTACEAPTITAITNKSFMPHMLLLLPPLLTLVLEWGLRISRKYGYEPCK